MMQCDKPGHRDVVCEHRRYFIVLTCFSFQDRIFDAFQNVCSFARPQSDRYPDVLSLYLRRFRKGRVESVAIPVAKWSSSRTSLLPNISTSSTVQLKVTQSTHRPVFLTPPGRTCDMNWFITNVLIAPPPKPAGAYVRLWEAVLSHISVAPLPSQA